MLQPLREMAARWRRSADKSETRAKEAEAKYGQAGSVDVYERYMAEAMTMKICALDLEEAIVDAVEPEIAFAELDQALLRSLVQVVIVWHAQGARSKWSTPPSTLLWDVAEQVIKQMGEKIDARRSTT